MKGILLAGGHGKRLLPFTKVRNKHLYPILGKEMFLHTLDVLKELNISNIIVVCKYADVKTFKMLIESNAKKWISSIKFVIQHEPLGVAHAINLSRKKLEN